MEAGLGEAVMAGAPGFDEFYVSSYRPLLHLAVLLTGDRQQGAELVHDAFVEAHRRWDVVAGYDRPDLWVRRVLVNKSRSWRRRRRNEATALSRWSSSHGVAPDAGVAPLVVWAHVRRLPSRQAAAVALVYGLDQSIAQAATVMGCSEGAVKTHLSRARARLAAELEGFR